MSHFFRLERDLVAVVTAGVATVTFGGNTALGRRGNPAAEVAGGTREQLRALDILVRELRAVSDPIADHFAALRPLLDRRLVGTEQIAKQRPSAGSLNSVRFLVDLTRGPIAAIANVLQGRDAAGAVGVFLRWCVLPEVRPKPR